jgi:hypothetical protein
MWLRSESLCGMLVAPQLALQLGAGEHAMRRGDQHFQQAQALARQMHRACPSTVTASLAGSYSIAS